MENGQNYLKNLRVNKRIIFSTVPNSYKQGDIKMEKVGIWSYEFREASDMQFFSYRKGEQNQNGVFNQNVWIQFQNLL
ncbi:unnamed protein product [Paramecium sonneborni]|uniref:Uncharacterized protein n=1 Tax=Paramecium sonneborni TaxID=65129 RepID=A0A8S1R1D6_9CILI|nr:unnamed protein product [Paramecium sonneborni]